MPRTEPTPPTFLTPAEREWIRRQGRTARTLEQEQREHVERLSIAEAARRLRQAESPRARPRVEA